MHDGACQYCAFYNLFLPAHLFLFSVSFFLSVMGVYTHTHPFTHIYSNTLTPSYSHLFVLMILCLGQRSLIIHFHSQNEVEGLCCTYTLSFLQCTVTPAHGCVDFSLSSMLWTLALGSSIICRGAVRCQGASFDLWLFSPSFVKWCITGLERVWKITL